MAVDSIKHINTSMSDYAITNLHTQMLKIFTAKYSSLATSFKI